MTAAVQRIERIGSTKPRLFTPPIAEHCGPTGELTEDWSWGYDCIFFLEKVCKWHLLPWQKWLYIHALEKGENQQGFRFKILIVLIARQNGKTRWLKGLGLWRLYMDKYGRATGDWPGARQAVIAAQNLDYAESMLKDVVDEVRDNPLLLPELINHKETNGKHRMLLTNRRIWRAATASRKGARSLSVDIAMLDELREHTTWDAWRAIVPTTTTRSFSQVVCASNAGDQRSEVLRAQRDACVRRIKNAETDETQMGFFEWSVPLDVDPHDPEHWYLANPSMGLLNDFTLDDLRGYLEAMEYRDMPGFQTEHLCQWVDALEPGVMPAEHWAYTIDHTSRRAKDAKLIAAVDINYSRTRGYVAIAARRADGNVHVEIVAAAPGTDWIIPWFVERKDKFTHIVIQKTGAPISGMIEEFTEAGIELVEVNSGVELAGAFGTLYDGVCEHVIYHRPALVLDRAAASAVARNSGESMVFDRRNSPVDASPLIACSLAAHIEANPPEVIVPQVHEWPDEDEIDRWQKEADKLWAAEAAKQQKEDEDD